MTPCSFDAHSFHFCHPIVCESAAARGYLHIMSANFGGIQTTPPSPPRQYGFTIYWSKITESRYIGISEIIGRPIDVKKVRYRFQCTFYCPKQGINAFI